MVTYAAENGVTEDVNMAVNVHLVLLVSVTLLFMEYLTLACNIETARLQEETPGGWSGVAVDDDSVVELKQTVVNDARVVKAHHVVESYQQVDQLTLVM